jgi:hypothetical protein
MIPHIILFFIIITGLIEAFWGLRQLYGFTYSQHSLFKLTGSFFNPGPYAGYLAVIFPLALYHAVNNFDLKVNSQEFRIKSFRYLSSFLTLGSFILAALTIISILLVLPAAMSRASWLAVVAGSLIVLAGCYYKHIKDYFTIHKRKILPVGIVSCILLFAAFAGMYFLKKDSADGRALMWKMALYAVKENPLGVGLGNFAGAYGEAQATYFAAEKGTETEELVAGNPEYGFNEYLQIAVEGGVVSLVIFFTILFFSLKSLIKNRKFGIAGSMVSLLVFAFFSYPFSILPFLIVFVFLLAMSVESSAKICTENKSKSAFIRKICVICVSIICISVTTFCLYKEYPKYGAYKKWNTDKYLYTVGLHNDVVESYEELYPLLNEQIQFLFEYAQSLSKTEQYAESNAVLLRAMQISCDPMLYNVMGNNLKAMGKYNQAENMYIRASHIVPNRHYPLYLLMKMYDETGQSEKAKDMAETLLNKPVKIPSTAIREMQDEAKKIKN